MFNICQKFIFKRFFHFKTSTNWFKMKLVRATNNQIKTL